MSYFSFADKLLKSSISTLIPRKEKNKKKATAWDSSLSASQNSVHSPLKYSADFLGAWLVLFTLSSIIWEIHCATGQSDSFHDAEVYGNCKSIKPQFALNKMKQQVVKWKLNPKLDNIFQETSLSLLLLLLPSSEKFNRADWGNLERAGYSFLWFVIAP